MFVKLKCVFLYHALLSRFSFSRTATLSPRVRTMPLADCLISGPIKSWPCTRTTTSFAASRRWRSLNRDGSCWPATTTSTATSGTRWEQNERVHILLRHLLSPWLLFVSWLSFDCWAYRWWMVVALSGSTSWTWKTIRPDRSLLLSCDEPLRPINRVLIDWIGMDRCVSRSRQPRQLLGRDGRRHGCGHRFLG